ncbi:unnamed protein product [Calicophoron daubneyi]|uniref:Uncharacterized protein n=1 Tax=Calicophoron daubneyi TaxID=300641 RepID=A0AAV2TSN4_CALDB
MMMSGTHPPDIIVNSFTGVPSLYEPGGSVSFCHDSDQAVQADDMDDTSRTSFTMKYEKSQSLPLSRHAYDYVTDYIENKCQYIETPDPATIPFLSRWNSLGLNSAPHSTPKSTPKNSLFSSPNLIVSGSRHTPNDFLVDRPLPSVMINGLQRIIPTEGQRSHNSASQPHPPVSNDTTVDLRNESANNAMDIVDARAEGASQIDTSLTQSKLEQLSHDVQVLEAAVRSNENEQKDLDDWFFEQMSAAALGGIGVASSSHEFAAAPTPSSSETGIKRIYEDKTKALKQRSKALDDQLQVTRYVMNQLEMRGIPYGVSPKTYVRHLIRHRGKGSVDTHPPGLRPKIGSGSHSLVPGSTDLTPTTVVLPGGSEMHYFKRHSANTMPALLSTSLVPQMTYARQAKTLPARVAGLAASTSALSPVRSIAPKTEKLGVQQIRTIASSASLITQSLDANTADPVASTRPSGEPLPGPRLSSVASFVSHPTSPDLFSANYGEQQPLHEPMYKKSSQTERTHKPSVLYSMKLGLENIGRQLRRTGRVRSASEEYFTTPGKDSSSDIPSDRSFKHSRAWGSSSKKSKKSSSHLNTTTYPPEASSLSADMRMGKSHSGSVGSGSGANLLTSLNVPVGAGGRSTSGVSTREEIAGAGASNSVGAVLSPEGVDQSLARILELLGFSLPTHSGPPVTGSSGSSVSVPALQGQHSGSTGPKSVPAPAVSTGDPTSLTVHHLVPAVNPYAPVAANSVALAFTALYQLQKSQMVAITNQQMENFQELREEFASMQRDNIDLQNTLNNLTAELESIRRDSHTREELQKQRLANATARIEQLDATSEESRQTLQHDFVNLRNELRDGLYSLEYQVTTKTRDLSDNITTLSNKISMLEKPFDQISSSGPGSDLARIRHKVLHTLTDLCVSFFALITMLLQLFIRCLNLGAVVTENRALAISVSVAVAVSVFFYYTSDQLISWIHGGQIQDFSSIPSTGSFWRDSFTTILSLFRRFFHRTT